MSSRKLTGARCFILEKMTPLFESLERRDLFSQNIRVAAFGARPNDGIDDYAAIVAAVATAKPGDRIRFSAGQYDLSNKVQLPSGISLIGYGSELGGQTTLRSADRNFALYFRGDGLKLDHLTFDGGAIYMDRYEAAVTNVNIQNSKFINVGRGGYVGAANGAIGSPGSDVDGFQLSNSTFDGAGSDYAGTAMFIYGGDNWSIHDNSFTNMHCGVKSNNEGWTAHNINIARNYFSGFDYHSVELQGVVNGFWFTDNYYENPRLSSNFSENDSIFAFSLIYAGSSIDQHILRNYVSAPERPDGTGVRLGFEIGQYAEVKDNYLDGIGTPWTIYGPKSYADGNYFSNILQWPYAYGYRSGKTMITSNNGDRVKVSWDIDRAKPGPKLAEVAEKAQSLGAAIPTNLPPVTRNFKYASDVKIADSLNGLGPVELDENNGGKPARDGGELLIDGEHFDKGLGVSGNSTVVYNLAGHFKKFLSDFGIDDVSGSRGTMTFQVWADGKFIFSSGVIDGSDELQSLNLDVRGVKQLKLITTDAGDGKGHDLGNWGSARFYA